MAFSDLKFPEHQRAQLRAHLEGIRVSTGSPMPPAAVDEIVDLACHAAAEARKAMFRVLDTASHRAVATTAVGIAASLLKADLEQIEAGIRSYAEERGSQIFETTVQIGVQAHG